jgi:enterochelin esterase family protein
MQPKAFARWALTLAFALMAPCAAAFAQTTPYTASGAQRLSSPEIAPNNHVTFRLHAPGAKQVTVQGDWPGSPAPMSKDEHGVWSATIGPLRPDIYTYWFNVDGVRALDPSNAETQRGGNRFASLLMVSGESSRWWDVANVPHGTIEQIWYASPTLDNAQRRMFVYLPPGYHSSGRRYPVLYLLHGGGGDEEAWTAQGRAPVILDNLIAAGLAEPMIVVMPNGIDSETRAQGSGLGPTPSPQQINAAPVDMARFAPHLPQIRLPYHDTFNESLVRDIVPFVDRTYRTRRDARHRAIAGLSLGAAQTVLISAHNPATFDYIGVFSGGGLVGEPDFEAQLDTLARNRVALYWTGAGDVDISIQRTQALYNAALAHGLPATYREVPGGHTWPVWRDFLVDFAPRLFK